MDLWGPKRAVTFDDVVAVTDFGLWFFRTFLGPKLRLSPQLRKALLKIPPTPLYRSQNYLRPASLEPLWERQFFWTHIPFWVCLGGRYIGKGSAFHLTLAYLPPPLGGQVDLMIGRAFYTDVCYRWVIPLHLQF